MSAIAPIPVQAPPPKQVPALTPRQQKKSPWLWIVLCLVAAVGLWAAYRAMTKPAPVPVAMLARTEKVVLGNLEHTIRLGGQTSARNFANITAPLMRGPEMRGDMVLMKLAASGSLVKKGDVVAQIDAQSIQDHIDDLNDT